MGRHTHEGIDEIRARCSPPVDKRAFRVPAARSRDSSRAAARATRTARRAVSIQGTVARCHAGIVRGSRWWVPRSALSQQAAEKLLQSPGTRSWLGPEYFRNLLPGPRAWRMPVLRLRPWRPGSGSGDGGLAVVETNLYGTWYVMQAAAREWIARKQAGSIVNIGTVMGVAPSVSPIPRPLER